MSIEHLTTKQRYWLNHLQAWERSGETIIGYTKRHKLTESGFYAWRRRLAAYLNGHRSARPSDNLFVPIELKSEPPVSSETIVVHHPKGWRIELPCHQIHLLGEVLRLSDAR